MLFFPSKQNQSALIPTFISVLSRRERERERERERNSAVQAGISDPQFIRINQSESVWQAQQGNLGTLFPYLLLE